MNLRVGLWRKLSSKKLMIWTVVLEKTLESPLDFKEIQPVHPKDQSWVFIGRTDAEAETPVLWPPHEKSWLMEKTLTLGGIGGRRKRGRQRMRWLDASRTRWTWVWVNSGSWWWTGRPGMLRFMGLQRVGHDWVTEQNWTGLNGASLVAQIIKRLPEMRETWVRSLGWEEGNGNPLQYSFLPRKFHGRRSLVGYGPWGCKESNMTEPFLPLITGPSSSPHENLLLTLCVSN